MKFALALLFVGITSHAQTTLECKSGNFNAQTRTGHAFIIDLDKEGFVTRAGKLSGSFFCDNVESRNLNIRDESEKVRVYELSFNCNALNERLVVPKFLRPHWVRFEFTWADEDQRYRRDRSFLICN